MGQKRQWPARLYSLAVHESVEDVCPTELATSIWSKLMLTSSMGSGGTKELPCAVPSAWSMCWCMSYTVAFVSLIVY